MWFINVKFYHLVAQLEVYLLDLYFLRISEQPFKLILEQGVCDFFIKSCLLQNFFKQVW